MTDTIDLAPSAKPDNRGKRAAVESELRLDPSRSNREIARIVGVDHKTVAATRAKTIPTISPPIAPSVSPKPDGDRPKPFNPFDPAAEDSDDCLVAQERLGLAVFINTRDNLVIANGNCRDGIDDMVQISQDDLPALIQHLQTYLPGGERG